MVKAKRIRGSEKREALFSDQSAATRTGDHFRTSRADQCASMTPSNGINLIQIIFNIAGSGCVT
jgi:hypothetical protein